MKIIERMAEDFSRKACEYGECENLRGDLTHITYGFLVNFFTIIILTLFALPFGKVNIVIVYYLIFITFRSIIGGWHTENYTLCFVFSMLIPLIGTITISFIDFSVYQIILTYFISGFIVLKFGTFVHPDRPLGKTEKVIEERRKRLKKIGIVILIMLFSFHIFFVKGEVSDAITIGIIVAFGNRLFAKK